MDQPSSWEFYEFRIGGVLGETSLGAFPMLRANPQRAETVLAGLLPDQAALFGVLLQIQALGLDLLEVRRVAGVQSDRTAEP